jgi:hypothetical protein
LKNASLKTTRLGDLSDFTGGLTSGLARQIVGEAEPAVRRIVRDERNKLAEAAIGGLPFACAAAVGYSATRYLVPDAKPGLKAVGYIASAGAAGIGALWTFMKLTGSPETAEAAASPGTTPKVVSQAAAAIIAEAEPKVRRIVDDEKKRLAEALETGIPWAVGAVAVFLATLFVAPSPALKATGYSATALLLGAGAWRTLEATKEATA